MSDQQRLRMRTKLAFGVGSIAEGAIYLAFNTWNFLFYNNVLGLPGTLCGLAVTISIVVDAISDPFIGSLSDRWRSRLGRRHPFLYAAALPLGITFYCLYAPPAGLTEIQLFSWFAVSATLQRLALTVYHIPHLALGAELSSDYKERSVVMAYNTIFAVLGGAGAVFFGWTWFSKLPGGATSARGYPGMAAVVALVSTLAILVCAHFTRDQIQRLKQPAPDAPPLTVRQLRAEIVDCLSNRNYRNLLLGFLLLGAALGTRETLDSYLGLFFWGLSAGKLRLFALAALPSYLLAFVTIAHVHERYDKRYTIGVAAGLAAFAIATPVTLRVFGGFLPNTSPALLPTLLLFHFIFYLGIAVLTISVLSALADVADEHELNTGRRQEGVFYAARTFFNQISMGAGHIVAGVGIDLIHFPKGARPSELAPELVRNLGILAALAAIPAVIAVVFYARYRIDRHRHAEIQRLLAQRDPGFQPQSDRPAAASGAIEPVAS